MKKITRAGLVLAVASMVGLLGKAHGQNWAGAAQEGIQTINASVKNLGKQDAAGKKAVQQTSEVIDITPENYAREITSFKGPIFLKYYDPGCPHCSAVKPTVEDLSRQYKGTVKFGGIDVSKYPKLAESAHIDGWPTFILFKAGKEVNRFYGASTTDIEGNRKMLKKAIETYLVN